MLRLEGVSARYGSTPALHDLSLEVGEGEFVTLIGANGAGKTTTLRAISGTLPATGGRISFRTHDITHARASTIVKAGITHSPEGRRVFPMMTVYENLQVGAHVLSAAAEIKASVEMVFGYFPRLAERRRQLAGHLSGGEQQMLAIGRALMSRPKLLLLDEPSLGLSPLLVGQVVNIVKTLHAAGITILLVEQNARLALSLADRAYVLETGRIVLEGTGRDLLNNVHVTRAYLGGGQRRH
ncbi:MAG TPA: ABC transporter ATP-binding protein [Bradyrhizobium sp.]|jgi:branched-chain amino acid transport system ATP-binding protein|nr:ABC transporter ATP-binding protein [Bradyrhizobium sp.]